MANPAGLDPVGNASEEAITKGDHHRDYHHNYDDMVAVTDVQMWMSRTIRWDHSLERGKP